MEISRNTLDYILEILNMHKGCCERKYCSTEERAYYDGLFTMACIFISDGYTSHKHILTADEDGNLIIQS